MLNYSAKYLNRLFNQGRHAKFQLVQLVCMASTLRDRDDCNVSKRSLHKSAVHLGAQPIQQRVWRMPVTESNVHSVIRTLKPSEQKILLKHLVSARIERQLYSSVKPPEPVGCDQLSRLKVKLFVNKSTSNRTVQKVTVARNNDGKPTKTQLLHAMTNSGMPYLIFGYLDNFLMIIIGDILELYLLPLGYSSLTSAALGNSLSDVISVFLSVYIEKVVRYFSGFTNVDLTEDQLERPRIKWLTELSKPLCVAIGTLVGMWPLYFLK